MEPVHRDDLDMDVAEALIKSLQAKFPGYDVVFAGDQPGGPSEAALKQIQQIQELYEHSFITGTCVDCGAQMPNYPPPEDDEGWEPADGWRWFTKLGNEDEIAAWQCPVCDAKEKDSDDE